MDDGQLADSFRNGSFLPAGVLQGCPAFPRWTWTDALSMALIYACFFLLSEAHSARNLPLFQITQISLLGFRNLGLPTVLRALSPLN